MLFWEKLIEKVTIRIKEVNDCKSRRDKNDLNHVLKNQELEAFTRLKKANGHIKTNTFSIIYLNELEKSKLNNPMDIKLFIRPSIVNIEKLDSSIVIIEFSLLIKLEKEISVFNRFFPISLIDSDIKLLIKRNFSQTK